MHALKVLHGWLLHELAYHTHWIIDVGPGDCQVYQASNNLLEPFLITGWSGVRMKLPVPVQGCADRSAFCHAECVQYIEHVVSL